MRTEKERGSFITPYATMIGFIPLDTARPIWNRPMIHIGRKRQRLSIEAARINITVLKDTIARSRHAIVIENTNSIDFGSMTSER